MRVRLNKVDEYQFLTCFKHGLWGANKQRFKEWKIGDFLVFLVDKKVTAYAEVVSKPFISQETVWDNGLFPHRIKLKFISILSYDNRLPILGEIRDSLIEAWGNSYGWGILNQQLLPEKSSEILINSIRRQPNNIADYEKNIELLLEEAKKARERLVNSRKTKRTKKEQVDIAKDALGIDFTEQVVEKRDESNHSKAQANIIEMGKITGCSVWIASNDRNRMYKGKALGKDCIAQLPNLGLNDEAMKRISLIDVIWIRQNAPVCAFEVETTTSVYSGLLRMSDLISVVPALNIKLFIVAPKEREEKVMSELRRPTFRRIGLNEYCKFIATEDLEKMLKQIKGLEGYITPDILDKIAIEAE
jgi:hypothetical protein